MVTNTLVTITQLAAQNNTTSTTTTAGSGATNMGVPLVYVGLGVAAIVVMTVAWFYFKKSGGGSD